MDALSTGTLLTRGEIIEDLARDLASCYGCRKCTGGCPTARWWDRRPHEIVRLLQLSLVREAVNSRGIWYCVGCKTCASRCPNGIDISRVADTLRALAIEEKSSGIDRRVLDFNRSFLWTLEQTGRLSELAMIAQYKARSRDLFSDIGLGLKMFTHRKLKLRPEMIRGRGQVKRLFLGKGGRAG